MATHDTAPWIGRMRVLRKNPEPGEECPARGYFAQGRQEAQRRCGLGWSFSHHARARQLLAQAGCKLSGNIKARSEPALPHDDRAVIENPDP